MVAPEFTIEDTIEARDDAMSTVQHLPFEKRVTTLLHAAAYEIALMTARHPAARVRAVEMAMRQMGDAVAIYADQVEQLGRAQ